MASKYVILAACAVLCASQAAQLKVSVLKDQPAEVLFKESTPGKLECIVENGQNVKYTWTKDGKAFTPSSDITQKKDEGTLEFSKPKSSDEGLYQCFAETEHGIASSRVISFKRAYLVTPQVTPKTHKPVKGKPFKLDCSAEGYPTPVISWKTQQEGSDKLEPYLNRRITSSPDGTLWFSNVTAEDVDPKIKYICVATSEQFGEVKLAEHVLTNLVEDKTPGGDLVPQYLSNDLTVKVGSVTEIWCIYGGTPLAHPDWFKNGKDVNGDENPAKQRVTRHNRTSGRRLLIKETQLEDEGTYKCVANNKVGKSQEHSMKLTVVSAPSFARKPEKSISVNSGKDVTIPCQAIGIPAPKLIYTFNGKPLANSNRIIVNSEGISVKNVQKSVKGYYGCRAQSEHGDDYVETLLLVV